MNDYSDIEDKIRKLLYIEFEHQRFKEPQNKENIESIRSLTELIMAASPEWSSGDFNHSICHLFERYGDNLDHGSYLNVPGLLDIADKLVNFTLGKAIGADLPVERRYPQLGCVERIIWPIIAYNLDHMDENAEGFAFKPAILNTPDFIEELEKYRKRFENERREQYDGYLLEFCKANSMNEFFAEYIDGLRKAKNLEVRNDDTNVLKGIYVDVDDTLVTQYWTKNPGLDQNLQKWLIQKLAEGIPVTIFTGGDIKGDINFSREKLKKSGADERLLDVKSKADYIGKTLEICIDDTPPLRQGFRAKKYYSSGKEALDKEV